MTPWVQLGLAILLEIAGTLMLKLSDGFAKPLWGMGALVLYALCFYIFAGALRAIPIGVAYAIWSGVGIVAITVAGFVLFGENLHGGQILSISLILAGAIGLRLTTAA